MRLLLDESLPRRLRNSFPEHEVATVADSALPVAIVVVVAPSNELSALLPLVPRISDVLPGLLPRTLVEVGA